MKLAWHCGGLTLVYYCKSTELAWRTTKQKVLGISPCMLPMYPSGGISFKTNASKGLPPWLTSPANQRRPAETTPGEPWRIFMGGIPHATHTSGPSTERESPISCILQRRLPKSLGIQRLLESLRWASPMSSLAQSTQRICRLRPFDFVVIEPLRLNILTPFIEYLDRCTTRSTVQYTYLPELCTVEHVVRTTYSVYCTSVQYSGVHKRR